MDDQRRPEGDGPLPGATAGSSAWPEGAAPSAASWSVQDGGEAPGARLARLAGGWGLVALGLWLLVAQYVHLDWNLLWPVAVMGAGVILIVVALRRRSG